MKLLYTNVYDHHRKCAVKRNKEFEKKGLATHSVDVGTLCGHGCRYCSTPCTIRDQRAFKETGMTAQGLFSGGYSVVDTDTPNRIAKTVEKLKQNDIVMFCPKTDGWSPESQKLNLGKQCLEAVLTNNSHCKVRVLSKNAAMANDLAALVQYKDRIMPSLSLTAPRSKSYLAQVVEPNASTIVERLAAMKQIHALGFRMFGMCCPAIPGLLTDEADIEELIEELLRFNPDTIWLEAVNGRGSGLGDTEAAFRNAGLEAIANKIEAIRETAVHDRYVATLVRRANKVGKKLGCDSKFKFLIYNDIREKLHDFNNVIFLGEPENA